MPIQVACVGCGAQLRVRDEYLGKAIKCPQCGQVLRPELPPETAAEAAEQVPVVQVADDGITEERPRSRRRRDDEDDESESEGEHERRPRRKSGYVRCPSCGAKRPQRVIWTFWGSFYGPALLNHVRCTECGTKYNGRTGGSNLIPAIIFVLVPLILIFVVLGALGWVLWTRLNPRRAEMLPPHVLTAQLTPGVMRTHAVQATPPDCDYGSLTPFQVRTAS
jgi:DNA-directed RNA polymerase subunit RPC12/RpoP